MSQDLSSSGSGWRPALQKDQPYASSVGAQPECQDGTRIEIEFSLRANGLNQLYLHSNPDQLSSKLAGW